MINFPIYAIRKYIEITKEGNYRIIHTARNRYVLDYVDSKSSSYARRRLHMMWDELPYDVYPLSIRVENFQQLVTGKYRDFVDANGSIVSWKPKKFYPVRSYKIDSKWQTQLGHTMLSVKSLHSKFKIREDRAYTHIQVLDIDNKLYLYDVGYDKKPDTRKKI